MFGVSSFKEQYNQLIMIESGGFNNTLAPYDNCNNSNTAVGEDFLSLLLYFSCFSMVPCVFTFYYWCLIYSYRYPTSHHSHRVIRLEQRISLFRLSLLAVQFVILCCSPSYAGNFGNVQSAAWANVYTKSAIKRLQPHIKGFKLNATTIVAMQQLCSYETVALGFSAFCDLFTEEEMKGYDYFFNVQFWYSNGPGGATVAAQYVILFLLVWM
jgi:hypothetical protein